MRERVTITLSKSILKQIDQSVNGVTIRNRSYAIETLLKENLSLRIKKVLILAGGQGVKMRPFTYELPKPLIPFRGKPLLEHTLELLRTYDLTDVVLSIGYLGQKIKDYFGDGSRFGIRITYSEENQPLGTAGAVFYARPLLQDESFLVMHGDILTDIDLKDFFSFFLQEKILACLALTSVANPSTFGVVQLEGKTITGFEEKPKRKKEISHLISAGIYLFNGEIFEILPSEFPASLETDVFPQVAKSGRLLGYSFSGQWFDISDPKTYEQALKHWKN